MSHRSDVSARGLLPSPSGLYDGRHEHDSCGVAFVATLSGQAGNAVVDAALTALRNLEHRGATGSESDTGDGAGISTAIPDAFLREVARDALAEELPPRGAYAVGTAFLPDDDGAEAAARAAIEILAPEEGLRVLGWRTVPTVPDLLGEGARARMPRFRQLFLAGREGGFRGRAAVGMALERRVFCLRKRVERETEIYFPSLSTRTLVYKGMLTAGQLQPFYPDLCDRRYASPLALVHSRFSTNTFPSWPLAHPYRLVAHNGEINTVRGNRSWMRAREPRLSSTYLPGDLSRLLPICTPGASDSASFDEVLELLHLGGRSLPHAVLMMVPEAWENDRDMAADDPARRAFYEYHATLMEPWDGPACIAFTDGERIGAVLDRNGLRPARYAVTDDGLVVLASETGVLDLDPARVVQRGRLQPGRMFVVDTAAGRILDDGELKADLAKAAPYDEWLNAGLIHLDDLPDREHVVHTAPSVLRRQQTFGYTEEELRLLLSPMARTAQEPTGSMGTDTPLAVLSGRPRLLFDYFTQMFAQVTNPPIDALREQLVTSLDTVVGPGTNVLEPAPGAARQVVLPYPVVDNDGLAKITHIAAEVGRPGFAAVTIRGLYPVAGGADALRTRLEEIRAEAVEAARSGARFLVLSDRHSDATLAPIPSLLLTSVVHHILIAEGGRTSVGLLVEAGDVREVHHLALLIGYGAAAVNPYLALETVEDLARRGELGAVEPGTAISNLIAALGKGLLKVMSKMGISTVASYRGAQVFEAVGLAQDFVDEYLPGTDSHLGGIGLDVVAEEVARRHAVSYPATAAAVAGAPRTFALDSGGEYQWRRDGELHLFDPETVFRLQHATRSKRYDIFRRYSRGVDEQAERRLTLRGMLRLREGARPPVPLEEVEPVATIVRRFATGAMSYGSISREAHETLAIAMNRLGGRSNSGEGGEDARRYVHDANGDSRRSAVHQVASGRFGVTSEYLVNADELQIKMAQGAKPGEGGQLPGNKVYPEIARTRHSTPGVGLISPPPHHDIYSIEDLKQLIYDLKNANPAARVSVKLVAEVGVGTVAAGVSKAKADVVLISGHDGGTGAAPLTSLKHAGVPWEIGLAETQQTLLLNGLRDRITVQVDGQMRTGRDVVIAALLGAEEYGFATAPLVVAGCIMMRVCHLDTCPVGIATQNPALRARFAGTPEFVETFFEFVAEEVREHLAALGLRSLDEAVGAVELLDVDRAVEHWKAGGLDLGPLLHLPGVTGARRRTSSQDHGLEKALDRELLTLCRDALDDGLPVTAELPVRNVHRAVGTLLGSELTSRYGAAGLPDDTIDLTLTGSAGQSFGAFLPRGITLRLHGDANDYVGKGLSGGRLVVRPDPVAERAGYTAERNVVAGNTLLYGATSGELFVRGIVGERFAVRNSGATAVVEGIGDHGFEYMTGGRVVVLGRTGRNVGAGMSGGFAYLLDLDRSAVAKGDLDLDQLDTAAAEQLRELVQRHADLTGSRVAAQLLADWTGAVRRFTVIAPRDYKRVLTVISAAEAAGRDPDLAVMSEVMGRDAGAQPASDPVQGHSADPVSVPAASLHAEEQVWADGPEESEDVRGLEESGEVRETQLGGHAG